MKILSIFIIYIFVLTQYGQSQRTQFRCDVVLSVEQGRIVKAQNNGPENMTFRFTYITEGKTQNGTVVSSVKEYSDYIELKPNESKQILTAPIDPQNKVVYSFKNVIITECSATKPPTNSRGINTRMNGGN
ncbi:MAG: hypothetical protein AB7V36_14675 [Bacteroidales bacterium]|nr:hypothetical protein [Bacteroidales bacterium]